ncbi:MAG: hypothetical protein A2Y50_03465 [Pseudomonadales bacterium RIFCSPLOWO2_12_59_9]|nr:MAG: hypothetical protein A2Y50_03465 [Pseudomonadales bacterium RIFCSPLOWO2_12_59_9]
MSQPTFADRYAEAGLTPNAQLITHRCESSKRIVTNITDQQILDLAATYYESPDVDLGWFRDEFVKEDASFSLVNNAREARVLAAAMLDQLVAGGNCIAILAVTVGHVAGKRPPSQAEWLVASAKKALGIRSVENRSPAAVEKIAPTAFKDLAQDIANTATESDWAKLAAVLGKVRTEAQNSGKAIVAQSNNALAELDRQMKLMREETQMLWWLIGGHSRLLERGFTKFDPQQAALVGAIDLGTLTTCSELGPVAAPAMLERVIAISKKAKGSETRELSTTIDSIALVDIEKLQINAKLPPRLAPITAAIDLARTIGPGAWHARFKAVTGFDASISFEPLSLAEQLYREHLLGQLL